MFRKKGGKVYVAMGFGVVWERWSMVVKDDAGDDDELVVGYRGFIYTNSTTVTANDPTQLKVAAPLNGFRPGD
jgi:hypothetical protein